MAKTALFDRLFLFSTLLFLVAVASPAGSFGQEPPSKQKSWPPQGKRFTLPVSRDSGVSSVGKERRGSNGGAQKLKLKGQQEFILFDVDPPDALKSRTIQGVLLHIRSAFPREAPLERVSLSTVASPWEEGSSTGYRPQIGASSYNQLQYGKSSWSYKGSTLMDVSLGRGNTLWRFADCSPPDSLGWQSCAVEPDVLAARLAGLSYGFLLYDDVGNRWSREGENFHLDYFPNRWLYSRESSRGSPRLEVWGGKIDKKPPFAVDGVELINEGEEKFLLWKTPGDRGGGKTLGFDITYKREGEEERPFPRHLVPLAGKEGEEVRMALGGIFFKRGEVLEVALRSVDSVGNRGKVFKKRIRLPSPKGGSDPLRGAPSPYSSGAPLQWGDLTFSVVDLLDKIDPLSGETIPPQKRNYKRGNHLFSADMGKIRLQAARNETVAFQVNIEGKAEGIRLSTRFPRAPELEVRYYQAAYVPDGGKGGRGGGRFPDPLVPLWGSFSIPSRKGQQVPGQKNHSLLIEIYVPHNLSSGLQEGEIILSHREKNLKVKIELKIWNFTLPDKLSFVPEMNAYGARWDDGDYRYYRLAHEHRTCLNVLPYGWDGSPYPAPHWEAGKFDWHQWDKTMGPLLDGTAFEDLPRAGEPVDLFYLPFNENWPASMEKGYRPSYWAEEAFSPSYKKEMKAAFQAFARHIEEKGWKEPIFQFYLNNKLSYRQRNSRNSATWFLDEPVNTQDFWALRWYGALWQEALSSMKAVENMAYRADISYTPFGRNILWGITDMEYLGKNGPQKREMKREEWRKGQKSYLFEYGTANAVKDSNSQAPLWMLSAWLGGASGVMPWQTMGGEESWNKGEQTALFYPSPEGPVPSVRLKAFQVGQQLIEYLTLYRRLGGESLTEMEKWIKRRVNLKSFYDKESDDDAGTIKFREGGITSLWRLRYALGEWISQKAPSYERSLRRWEFTPWKERKIPDLGYVTAAPGEESSKPAFRP